jgi:hypothetical protein
MFILPAVSALAYSSIVSFSKMFDRRDQKTLEKLRAERLAKINELKERTNYYTTQQLIQVRLLVLRTQRICGNSVYDKY